jgi:Kef-type K+ transport system membrane component KefB
LEIHLTLITLGALFVVGLVADELGRRTKLPRVTLLVLLGVLIGPVWLDLLPPMAKDWYDLIASIALTMVAFLLGAALSRDQLRAHGREIVWISVAVVAVTIFVVFGGLFLVGIAPVVALLLAGIATATDPAATQEVIRDAGTKGPFVETLKGIVAIDDAWGLIAFSMILAFSNFLVGNGLQETVADGLWDVFGAIGVGIVVGFPAAYLTGRLRDGEPMQAEALAVVFLCAGIALWLEVSFLLAGIVAGAIIVNFAPRHTRAFSEIEHFEWPFMLVFFLLAGSRLYTENWASYGLVVAAFVVLRIVSRLLGGWLGAKIAGSPKNIRNWIGSALLPQAGVAVGMALIAGSYFPSFQEEILNVAIITTIIFEVLGPIATRVAILKNALTPTSS